MTIIENITKDSGTPSEASQPVTPGSIRNNEIIANAQALDSGSNSQEDSNFDPVRVKLNLELTGGEEEGLMPTMDRHMAKYDYAGGTDIELGFRSGDVVQVLEKADNGWWQGECRGQVGWFPESYVDAEPIRTEAGDRVRGASESRAAGGAMADAEVEKPRNMDETMASGMKN